MDLVRILPTTNAAPELARSAVDLAVGHSLPPADADAVKALADELLTETVSRAGDRIVEFRIRSEPRSVRLEVRWTESTTEQYLWAERSIA
jgi:hypothetical protein